MNSRTHQAVLVLCICALLFTSTAAAAPQLCRSSGGGSTASALGEEFPEFALPMLIATVVGQGVTGLVVWLLATASALGEEFPERVCAPRLPQLGEEFPE
ncbi:MAG: hypothetical protein FJY75_13800 [Candidatus Eisenbacteria bacterium]|uniref:Uncharacterized protein n=1 Tax=Eiseniibacteriota bacterium TaxID=2212470 RepID=A0A938BS03_UNCEI|nr:hypothetical protein [Candidatus Eisenbacteria bacterium]